VSHVLHANGRKASARKLGGNGVEEVTWSGETQSWPSAVVKGGGGGFPSFSPVSSVSLLSPLLCFFVAVSNSHGVLWRWRGGMVAAMVVLLLFFSVLNWFLLCCCSCLLFLSLFLSFSFLLPPLFFPVLFFSFLSLSLGRFLSLSLGFSPCLLSFSIFSPSFFPFFPPSSLMRSGGIYRGRGSGVDPAPSHRRPYMGCTSPALPRRRQRWLMEASLVGHGCSGISL